MVAKLDDNQAVIVIVDSTCKGSIEYSLCTGEPAAVRAEKIPCGEWAGYGTASYCGGHGIFVSMTSYKTNQIDENNRSVYRNICYPVTG